MEPEQAVQAGKHNAGVLQVGHHQGATCGLGLGIGARHAQLAAGGQQADGQQPQAGLPAGPGGKTGDAAGDQAQQGAAQAKEEHGARFGLAHARQRHDLHIGHGRQHPGAQADQRGSGLLLGKAGLQHQHHAHKTRHDGQQQRHIQRLRCAAAARVQRPQGTGQQEHGNPDAAHVVEGHGAGQRHLGDGVEPAAHGRDADQAAPGVHPRVAGFQGYALGGAEQPHGEHADQATVEHDFCGVEMHRRVLDADPHGGEQKRPHHHP